MTLLNWQKLTYVIPGMPSGRGKDGAYSSSTIPTMTYLSASGTAGSTTLTVGANSISNGTIIKIIQSWGTNAGQWEFAMVLSGGGTTTFTLTKPLIYTYTDSGFNQAQVIKVWEFTTVTQTGTWSPTTWNQNVGGEFIIAAKVFNNNGIISASASGYRGGDGVGRLTNGHQGEGYPRDGQQVKEANGNGGGGGERGTGDGGSGGGGSNGSQGINGTSRAGHPGGTAGAVAGDLNLQSMVMAGGGGSGSGDDDGNYSGNGGWGGGNISIFAKLFNTPNSIISNGGNGLDGSNNSGTAGMGGGGGGAGGNILICAETLNIGTDILRVIGGNGGNVGGRSLPGDGGGYGGKGRIALYYGLKLTGSVSSSYYGTLQSQRDLDLIEAGGASLFGLV